MFVNAAPRGFSESDYDRTFTEPTHNVDLGLGYDADPFDADIGVRWQSERTLLTPNDTTTFEVGTVDVDHVFDLSAKVGYRLTPNLKLSLLGTDLFGGADWGAGTDIDAQALLSLRWEF
jgi:hypothetical protein